VDLCRVETAIDSTPPLPSKNKNTLFIVLYRLFADCLKCHFSISFSEEMVGMFNFIFVRWSFLGIRYSKNIKKSDIKIFGLVPC